MLPPIRTVQRPGVARQKAPETANAEVATATETATETDKYDDFFDTGSLELARESADGDNPYDTHTWDASSGDMRRVDDLSAVNKERKSGTQENPYDTIVKRKGW